MGNCVSSCEFVCLIGGVTSIERVNRTLSQKISVLETQDEVTISTDSVS